MQEARLLCSSIGPARNHRLIPMLDRSRRMLCAALLDPVKDGSVVIEPIRRLFKRIGIQFQKGEKMLIEPDSFIIISVEQSLPVKPGFVNQPRQMHIAAQS